MSRPQPYAARPWLLRALLALLTLTGLGVWQGGHCTDRSPGTTIVAAVSAPQAATVDGDTVAGRPDTTAGTCHITAAAVTTTTVAATPVLPAVERAAATAPRPRSLTPCFSPGVALTRLGVSRT